ncbi:MAG: ribbon-helix-helix protein, CopG family [Candidatus Lokiarchaeota archaeon]|nr:ribbon-helix-helix protein, CopG family [Candidatus Lokiarchaeota archaeon]
MKTLSVRIDEKEDKELDSIAKKMKTDKSTVVRRAIELGIKNLKKIEAFENIRLRKWTIWKAAEYCGESYRSFLSLLREENIPFPLSTEELEREIYENSS